MRPNADINVTPLIDVLLVLLIIFMAALPLTQRGMDVALPQPAPPQVADTPPPKAIVLDYSADGRLAINHQPVTLGELSTRLDLIFRGRTDKTLFLIGDGRLPYGRIVDVIDAAKGVGVERVGIVTESMRAARQ